MITAAEIFAARQRWEAADEMFNDSARTIIGGTFWQDVSFDPYDASFELLECADGLRLTLVQVQAFAAMGFEKCWLCHHDGRETRYYAVDGTWGFDRVEKNREMVPWEAVT